MTQEETAQTETPPAEEETPPEPEPDAPEPKQKIQRFPPDLIPGTNKAVPKAKRLNE